MGTPCLGGGCFCVQNTKIKCLLFLPLLELVGLEGKVQWDQRRKGGGGGGGGGRAGSNGPGPKHGVNGC